MNFSQFGNDLYTGKRSIDFIGRQKFWYLISLVLIGLACAGIFGRGLNTGIEFRGGSDFRISQVVSTSDYEAKAKKAMGEAGIDGHVNPSVIGERSVRVQAEATGQDTEKARSALAKEFGVTPDKVSASTIGPSWGKSVSSKAIQALVVFLMLVGLVMAVYFRTWKMAVAGLVALLHDLVITVGIYALFGLEVTPSSVIGFLTILGYSLYDTVVVFDKVRENTNEAFATKRMGFRESANLAVNQTLVRSINTTVVALLPIAAVLFVGFTMLGPGTLLDLSLALFIGIAVGAYSSVFIASPILVDLRRGEQKVRALEAAVAKRREKEAVKAERAMAATGGDRYADADGDALIGGTEARSGTSGTSGASASRPVHARASGPRNQPRRTPRSKR